MIQNFEPSLALVLQSEGGFVSDPQDAGGATNAGVTQHVYDSWRTTSGLCIRSVKLIERGEIEAIYKRLYWDACNCSLLEGGLDYTVFDFAVNSGAYRASQFLQRAVGAADDGHIGPATLAAVNCMDPMVIVDSINAARRDFLKRQPNFPHFGNGWLARVASVSANARQMAVA